MKACDLWTSKAGGFARRPTKKVGRRLSNREAHDRHWPQHSLPQSTQPRPVVERFEMHGCR